MSHKNNDRHGRWRDKIVSFRVSRGEDEMLERKVALSGKTKQNYIIDTLLDKTITALKKQKQIQMRSHANESRIKYCINFCQIQYKSFSAEKQFQE